MNPKLSLDGRIYTLSTGGAHSRLLAHIANPTSPPYVGTQLSSVPHTATVEMPCLQHCSTNSKLCILLVKAQPCTPSTWPLSPTRLGIRPARPAWVYPTNILLATVAFLLLPDTDLLPQAGISHYSELHDTTALY